MIYTFLVLIFGVYLGQEYPQIPSIKTTVQIFVANFNKVDEQETDLNLNEQSDPIRVNIVPKRRKYNSLPLWISNWFSSSESESETFVHEKTE